MPDAALSPVALALGRVPTGLYVVTADAGEGPLGFVGSFLVQVGFDPPTICVAVGQGRAPLAAMRAAGRFAVSILDPESSRLMGAFFKRYEPGQTAFDHVAHAPTPGGGPPILTGALAWLACRVTGEHATGDHVVFFGAVTDAGLAREGDPSVHLRKNGLAY
jgi:flavin reductase (DIM6/NTAB) family NADH-FMN oxidoreductase RutF